MPAVTDATPRALPSLPPRFGEGNPGEYGGKLKRWLERDSLSLRFDGATEAEYLVDRTRSYLSLARLSLAIALAFFVGYLVADALSFRAYVHGWLWATLLGLCALPVALLIGVSFLEAGRRHYPRLAVAVLVLNGTGLVGISVYGNATGVQTPYEILIIHLLYDFFLIGVRFSIALPLALVAATAYSVLNAMAGLDPHALFESSVFLFGTVLLGAMACRLLEATQRKGWLQAQALREMARLDPVTGLLNNKAFYARCEQVLRQAGREDRPAALAVIDLDKFKEFNDTQGHLAGDDCLRRIADAVRDSARRPLDLAARLGGDEFAAVWFDTSDEEACGYAERLRVAVERLGFASADARHLRVTVSIGIAGIGGGEPCTPQRLVREADSAMYRAKQAGGNLIAVATAPGA